MNIVLSKNNDNKNFIDTGKSVFYPIKVTDVKQIRNSKGLPEGTITYWNACFENLAEYNGFLTEC